MLRNLVVSLLLLICGKAYAAEAPLSGADIAALLAERSLYADGVEQVFRKSGQTFYLQNGSSSAGSWKVEGDNYCSQWPPNQAWSCYAVLRDGNAVIFVSRDGKRFPMQLNR